MGYGLVNHSIARDPSRNPSRNHRITEPKQEISPIHPLTSALFFILAFLLFHPLPLSLLLHSLPSSAPSPSYCPLLALQCNPTAIEPTLCPSPPPHRHFTIHSNTHHCVPRLLKIIIPHRIHRKTCLPNLNSLFCHFYNCCICHVYLLFHGFVSHIVFMLFYAILQYFVLFTAFFSSFSHL